MHIKTILVAVACFSSTIGFLQAQSSVVQIDAGLLENALGTAAVPVGGLLQLIASPSGTFSAPTSASYVTGDNILLQSQAMDYSSGTTGETLNSFTLSLSGSSYSLSSGEQLLLRFYPNLTLSSMPAAPTLGTSYGQVRSSTIEFGAAGGDPTETPWVVPASGQAHLDYLTVSDNGGTYANNTAFATNIVGPGAVPEPSSLALIGGAALSFAGWAKMRRR